MLARDIDLTAGTELIVEIHDPNLFFCARRGADLKPNLICIDWSNGELDAEAYAEKLDREGDQGCHLYIDVEGNVHQFADLWLDYVMHSQPALDMHAIWIVLQNQGLPPENGVKRGAYLHEGKRVLAANSDQIEALVDVVVLICLSLGLPPVMKETVRLASQVMDTPAPGPGIREALEEAFAEILAADEDDEEDDEIDEDAPDLEGFDLSNFDKDFPDPS